MLPVNEEVLLLRCLRNKKRDFRVALLACMDYPEPFRVDLSQNAMRFLDRIAYDKDYDGFANATEEGERLAKVLKDKDLLMMGQHGVMMVARRACDAFDELYYLERAAEIQVGCRGGTRILILYIEGAQKDYVRSRTSRARSPKSHTGRGPGPA